MAILPKTTGVHHFALRSTDLNQSRHFYLETLGFTPLVDTDESFIFLAGSTVVGILAPGSPSSVSERFPSTQTVLDHVALGCDDEGEIARVAAELTTAGVPNTGVKDDTATGKTYVAFDAPDGVIWELYLV